MILTIEETSTLDLAGLSKIKAERSGLVIEGENDKKNIKAATTLFLSTIFDESLNEAK
jgi:hypothetical protein